jgi:hypothetical protein
MERNPHNQVNVLRIEEPKAQWATAKAQQVDLETKLLGLKSNYKILQIAATSSSKIN